MLYEGLFFFFMFLSLVGSALWLAMRGLERLLHIRLPFFAHVAALGALLIPVASPDRVLIVLQDNWLDGYCLASRIWLWGALACAAAFLSLRVLACLGARRFPTCEDGRTTSILNLCANRAGLLRPPVLRCARLQTPAVCMGCIRPQVLVDPEILDTFDDCAIEHIFLHELTHIRRKHLWQQTLFDLACCLHWFNPIIWMERNVFALVCEQDCDACVVSRHPLVKRTAYMRTILLALTSSARHAAWSLRCLSPGISGFRFMKCRLDSLTRKDSRGKQRMSLSLAAVLICVFLCCSVYASVNIFESRHPTPPNPLMTELA